jgi:hypothetical protein
MGGFRSVSQRAEKIFFQISDESFQRGGMLRSNESTFMLMTTPEGQQECRPRDRAAGPAARKRQRFPENILSDMVETDLLALSDTLPDGVCHASCGVHK